MLQVLHCFLLSQFICCFFGMGSRSTLWVNLPPVFPSVDSSVDPGRDSLSCLKLFSWGAALLLQLLGRKLQSDRKNCPQWWFDGTDCQSSSLTFCPWHSNGQLDAVYTWAYLGWEFGSVDVQRSFPAMVVLRLLCSKRAKR